MLILKLFTCGRRSSRRSSLILSSFPELSGGFRTYSRAGITVRSMVEMTDSAVVTLDDGKEYLTLKEGQAAVHFPKDAPEEVFYNPGILFYSN